MVAFILAGLSLIALLSTTSKLAFWRDFLWQNFGWLAFLAPLLFLLVGLVLQKTRWFFAQTNVLLGLITVTVSLAGLSGFLGERMNLVSSSKVGSLGQLIWGEIQNVLTPSGGVLALLGTLIVGLLVLFDTSLGQLLAVFVAVFSFFKNRLVPFLKKPQIPQMKHLPIKVSGIKYPTDDQLKQITKRKEEVIAEELVQNVAGEARVWRYPPLSLLSDKIGTDADRGDIKKNAAVIEKTLDAFGIQARVAEVNGGPAVTQYALEMPAGVKISKIAALQHDLALALATPTGTVRVEAPIPGKSLVGIEVPNRSLEMVGLKSILSSEEMGRQKSKLVVALGRDTSSKPLVINIAKMPHVLVAGTTGSGKSVLINTFIASLLFRNSPQELKLILVDPKRVELANFNGIPHLLTPVITEPDKILSSLKWAMAEMERRYKLFQSVGVRNIQGYNELSGFQALPNIVILVDELADLMMYAPVEIEDAITRLAQLARATGIHLVVATQRPSVDVITGLIKANIPCRIAFNVSSMVDSRVIIDQPGAEKLLGRGDMLFLPPDVAKPIRIQGVFVSDAELNNLIKYLKNLGVAPEYTTEVTEMPLGRINGQSGERDELFEEAVRVVCQYDRASASLLQRRLRVGYARAARIIDELEAVGIIGPGEGSKPRDVLMRNAEEYLASRMGAPGS